jgi:hypothetical protein
MNTPTPQERNPLATHTDPSLRRDRSLRRRQTRAARTAAAGIEWVTPTELALRAAAAMTAAGSKASVRMVSAARRRVTAAARGASQRARRLAPVSAFGAGRRGSGRRGMSL